MAISLATQLAVGTGTGSASFTTASSSPVANRLLVWVQASYGAGPTHNAPTAWGLTWTNEVTASLYTRASIWTAWTGSTNPASGTATVNFSGSVATAWWYCATVTNGYVAQSGTSTWTASGGPEGATLPVATARSPLSITFAAMCNNSDSTANMTSPERTVLVNTSAGSTPNRGRLGVQWYNGFDDRITIDWTGSIGGTGVIVEIAHRPNGPPFMVPKLSQVHAIQRSAVR